MQRRERHQDIVDRFDELARARFGKLNRVADICAELRITQRTLVRAVRAIHGTTPAYRLRMLRLNEARNALLSLKARTRSVTDVAMRLGFVQLGRFAADYRKLFGESPSETLRRAVGCTPAAAANNSPSAARNVCSS